MFFGQFVNDLSKCTQSKLLVDPGRAQEPLVQPERAEGVGKVTAVQLEQARDGVDVLTDAGVGGVED